MSRWLKAAPRRLLKKLGIRPDFMTPERRLKWLLGKHAACPSTSGSPVEKLFVYDQACESVQLGRFLEVGSYLGSSAILLAEALRRVAGPGAARLYCIDTWQNDAMTEGARDTFEIFRRNTQPWQDYLVPVIGRSQEVKLPCDGPYDLVFIDADHSYEGCRADVTRFAPLLREGGTLLFDDHISFTGVTRAIGELLAGGEWFVGASCDNLIALFRDGKSVGKPRRKRVGNRSV